ncbi:MAG: glycosyltransferase family 2 protein [Bacteroidetes bacterium]|nr:glycosyltransferase family 2 protein [Bacteroidota bacterium]
MNLAPIVLFTYNRPFHTQQVLDSLAQNIEAKDSLLYIFCDGAKENASAADLEKIKKTREIVNSEKRFKEVIVTEQIKNKGLAGSVIDGVTEVVNKHSNVIVLEDDLVLSPYFLLHMNDSLTRYEKDPKICQIGACNFFACGPKYPDVFFLAMSECWGWATWKNRWEHFNPNAQQLLEKLQEKNLIQRFNAYGSYDMEGMLKDQILGKVSSWAIRWQAVCVINGWLTLYPNPAYTNHIESKEATHANDNVVPPMQQTKPVFKTFVAEENAAVIEAMKLGYAHLGDHYGNPIEIKSSNKLKKFFNSVFNKYK